MQVGPVALSGWIECASNQDVDFWVAGLNRNSLSSNVELAGLSEGQGSSTAWLGLGRRFAEWCWVCDGEVSRCGGSEGGDNGGADWRDHGCGCGGLDELFEARV